MSTWTKKKRRDNVYALCGIYNVPATKVSKFMVDHCIDIAKREVFMMILPERAELFRKKANLDHDEVLPARWVGNARNVRMSDGGSGMIRFRFGDVEDIPRFRKSDREAATANDPVYYFEDGKIKFLPDASPITGVDVDYYEAPADHSPVAVADNTTDSMPEDVEPMISRGAFERLLKVLAEEKEALQLTQEEFDRTQAATAIFYSEVYHDHSEDAIQRNAEAE